MSSTSSEPLSDISDKSESLHSSIGISPFKTFLQLTAALLKSLLYLSMPREAWITSSLSVKH